MYRPFLRGITIVLTLLIAACTGNDPGPLNGTWQMGGAVPMIITFRAGETEALGMIEKVSYKTSGNDVLVTYEDGIAKGTTMRFTVTGPDTIKTELGPLRRVTR